MTKNYLPMGSARTALLAAVPAISPGVMRAGGGEVLPPTANPHGLSLDDMAVKLALFNTSGNDLTYYPQTPFQILFQDPAKQKVVPITCPNSGSGVSILSGNTFVVGSGTPFFVPLISVDDSTPVIGAFPASAATAASYFFDASQVGGKDFAITVDGKSTPVGPPYLAGPVETPPLLDGGGTHLIQLGVFLTPMSVGTHTVTITGQVAGAALLPALGVSCVTEDFTYVVKVVPANPN